MLAAEKKIHMIANFRDSEIFDNDAVCKKSDKKTTLTAAYKKFITCADFPTDNPVSK